MMFLSKLKLAAIVSLAVGLGASCGVGLTSQATGNPPGDAQAERNTPTERASPARQSPHAPGPYSGDMSERIREELDSSPYGSM